MKPLFRRPPGFEHYSRAMPKLLLSAVLLIVLTACAATSELQEQCTPQWPPGPCNDAQLKK